MKSFKILSIIATLCFSIGIPAFALSENSTNGTIDEHHSSCDSLDGEHSVGSKRHYTGEGTYGYSFVNPSDNSQECFSRVRIGRVTFPKAFGVGYAQSPQELIMGEHPVGEEHGIHDDSCLDLTHNHQ
ncbi:MAG: hypothetical protein ACRC28_08150 [Clostridium sp.]|uniref:hypothetical protein n=1 Tax=Clostridium sp. TaxID=1506 RepID=UPI003F3977BB